MPRAIRAERVARLVRIAAQGAAMRIIMMDHAGAAVRIIVMDRAGAAVLGDYQRFIELRVSNATACVSFGCFSRRFSA